MGNCIERWRQEEAAEQEQEETEEHRPRAKRSYKDDDDDEDKGVGMKVKIVLTRHELEMFLLQLSENYDGKLMMSKDVAGALQKNISSSSSSSSPPSSSLMAWKPSLESIMECPEVQEMDR